MHGCVRWNTPRDHLDTWIESWGCHLPETKYETQANDPSVVTGYKLEASELAGKTIHMWTACAAPSGKTSMLAETRSTIVLTFWLCECLSRDTDHSYRASHDQLTTPNTLFRFKYFYMYTHIYQEQEL